MSSTLLIKGFAVTFQNLGLWNPGSYRRLDWAWPEEELRPLGLALERKHEPLGPAADLADVTMISLSFGGEITRRDVDVNSVVGNLFAAAPGDVVFSKIDVRHGAIGIVPEDLPRVAVTSEFPVFRIVESEAIPRYVTLLFRTARFRSELNSKVSGASGRKRINPDQLVATRVPLPPLNIQQAIVAVWEGSALALRDAADCVANVTRDLDLRLREACGDEALRILQSRMFALDRSSITRWDVANLKAGFFSHLIPDPVYLNSLAEDATELVNPTTRPDHLWPVYGVNNQRGVFFSHLQAGEEFNAAYKRIKAGWFFHNPTRSSVGSLGMVPAGVPDDAITSPEYQVWRLKSDVDANFIATLIKTPLFIKLISLHRSGGVKQRLYTENLLGMCIPRVPDEVQSEIAGARRVALQREEVVRARHKEVERELEEIIVGVRPYPESD